MRRRLALSCAAIGAMVWGAAMQPRAMAPAGALDGTGAATQAMQAFTVQTGTGAISGVVTDGATGQPIDGAIVSLAGPGRGGPGPLPRQLTDARGRFVFTRLPAFANYALSASKPGYFTGSYKETPGINVAVRLELRDGQWFQQANLTLWRPAAITGTVRDERGEPLVGIPVRALVRVRVAGHEQWASGPDARTDDRGRYRLAGLRPGAYVIQVPSVQLTLPGEAAAQATTVAPPPPGGAAATAPTPLAMTREDENADLRLLVGVFPTPLPGSGATAYPMAFHPTARSLDQASAVTVDYGDERTDVDVQMDLVPTVRVSGHLTGDADVLARVPVRILPVGAESIGDAAEAALTLSDDAGAFTFLRVPAGDYVVVASTRQFGLASPAAGSSLGQIMPSRAQLFAGGLSTGGIAGTNNLRYVARTGRGPGVMGRIPLSVGRQDVRDLVIPLQAGVTVTGHYLWDESPNPPEGVRTGPVIRLEPAGGDLSLGLPFGGLSGSRDPTPPVPVPLEITRVLPGRYVIDVGLGTQGFSVASIEYEGRDLLNTFLVVDGSRDITGVVVHLTSRTTSLTGYVRTSAGSPVDSGAVLFFPTDQAAWRDYGLSASHFKTATITPLGSYRAPALVPGEYFVAAVSDQDRQRWTDPEFLQTLVARAARLTVAPGLDRTLDLVMEGSR
ncbi:MAG: carboxypeptidase-like regulatory domain-containing protein [Vicinamibacterales bacterium]